MVISRGRAFALASLAVLFTMMITLIPGGGLVDLIDGFVHDTGSHVSRFVGLSHGIIAVFIVAGGLLAQLPPRRRRAAGLQQVAAAALAVALAGVAGGNYLALVEATVVAGFVVVLLAIDPARRRALTLGPGPDSVLLGLGIAGAIPFASYALTMILAERAGRSPLAAEDMGAPLGLHGWASLAALALAIAFLFVLAAWRTDGWLVTAATGCVAAAAFGLASILHPGNPGSVGQIWGGLAVLAGVLYGATAAWRGRRRGQL
jgi:hypothetical protein